MNIFPFKKKVLLYLTDKCKSYCEADKERLDMRNYHDCDWDCPVADICDHYLGKNYILAYRKYKKHLKEDIKHAGDKKKIGYYFAERWKDKL